MRKKLMEQLRRAFRPEFLNRVDATIVFRSLSKAEITQIVDLLMLDVAERLTEHDVLLKLTQAAIEYLADEGYDPEYGARPLRRVIQNQVEDALSDGILAGRFEPGHVILIDYVDDELVLSQEEEIEEEPEPLPS
jgi:ATP-dependent Clp protease ATP-binding subunit ClpC